MERKLILSIDGGGIRGVIPLTILRTLENRLTKGHISDYVNIISGTSTGALIVSALCVGNNGRPMRAEDILRIYKHRGKQMFVANQKGGTVYRSLPLARIIDQNFGHIDIGNLQKDYFFPLLNVEKNEPFIIHSMDPNLAYKNSELSSLLKAASAVPNYFAPVDFEGKTLADGVVFAKNPSGIVMKLLSDQFKVDDCLLLSLGTGHLMNCNDEIEEKAISDHHCVKSLFDRTDGKYFRLQPEIIKASQKMDDASSKNIDLLIEDAEKWIADNSSLLDQIVSDIEAFN